MSYQQQRVLAIAVAVALAMLGAVSLGNAETLGLTPRLAAWLTIVSTGLGILQGFLPRVQGSDAQPEHIANRIMDLSLVERSELIDEIEHRRRLEKLGQEDTA